MIELYPFRDTIRKTTNHETLYGWLQVVEAAIKMIAGEDPSCFYSHYPRKEAIEEIHELLETRRLLLDKMFAYTDEEVEAFERVNGLLSTLRKQMYNRTVELYRTMLRYGVSSDFDDDYNVEGTLNSGIDFFPADEEYDGVVHLSNDKYYGSDFGYMLYVLRENEAAHKGSSTNIEECFVRHRQTNTHEMKDEELHCDWRALDDGVSWIEWHKHPKFDHINVCYALHSMFDHHLYSLADIVRLNDFEVEAKITCQHFTDQKGRRYEEFVKR